MLPCLPLSSRGPRRGVGPPCAAQGLPQPLAVLARGPRGFFFPPFFSPVLTTLAAALPEMPPASMDAQLAQKMQGQTQAMNAQLDASMAAKSQAMKADLAQDMAGKKQAMNAELDASMAAKTEAMNAQLDQWQRAQQPLKQEQPSMDDARQRRALAEQLAQQTSSNPEAWDAARSRHASEELAQRLALEQARMKRELEQRLEQQKKEMQAELARKLAEERARSPPFLTIPAPFNVDKQTASPFQVFEPPQVVVQVPTERVPMPAVPAVNPLVAKPVDAQLCRAFVRPKEKIDVGCKWHQKQPGAVPECASSHTPSSLMASVERCDPDLFSNLRQRIKQTLDGVANDCTWIVVNGESYARLFCDSKGMPVMVLPRRPHVSSPTHCAQLREVAPNGVIDVGCTWRDREMAPTCESRDTPKKSMYLLKECDRDVFENVFAMAVRHIRGERTPCAWSVTPVQSSLVSPTQVLVCPFTSDRMYAPPTAINATRCAQLVSEIPDAFIPVGCMWDREDKHSLPKCLSTRTPNHEMELLKKCDAQAFDNMVVRVRSTLMGVKTDCLWRSIGSQKTVLFCPARPAQVIALPERPVPHNRTMCVGLVEKGEVRTGCQLEKDKVWCESRDTPNHWMDALRHCDVHTWRLVRKLMRRVAEHKNPKPCKWAPANALGVRDMVCPLGLAHTTPATKVKAAADHASDPTQDELALFDADAKAPLKAEHKLRAGGAVADDEPHATSIKDEHHDDEHHDAEHHDAEHHDDEHHDEHGTAGEEDHHEHHDDHEHHEDEHHDGRWMPTMAHIERHHDESGQLSLHEMSQHSQDLPYASVDAKHHELDGDVSTVNGHHMSLQEMEQHTADLAHAADSLEA